MHTLNQQRMVSTPYRKLEDDIMKDPNKILPAVRIKLLDKIWVRITPSANLSS